MKKVLLFSLFVILIGISFVSAECIESDEGKDYGTKGLTEVGPTIQGEDYCYNENQLKEYYCVGENDLDFEVYDCAGKCEDGACIPGSSEETNWVLENVWPLLGVLVVILIVLWFYKFKKK